MEGQRTETTDVDPLALVTNVEAMWERAVTRTRAQRIEVYHRLATRRVVEVLRGGTACCSQAVIEEGLALRRVERGGVAFAACSGASPRHVDWLADRTEDAVDLPRVEVPAWGEGDGALRCDHDAAPVPGEREIEEVLRGWVSPSAGAVVTARLEVATTTETWVAHGGLRASRRRTRTAAVAHVVSDDGGREEETVRSWGSRGWRAPDPLPKGTVGGRQGSGPVEIAPEASAALVEALVAILHGADRDDRAAVGPGWVIADEPERQDAMRGGSFDDAGFPTARRVLADGRQAVARIAGPGHLLRGSYRDRPAPGSMCLVVDPPRAGISPAWRVEEAQIFPVDRGLWILRTGAQGAVIGPIDPLDLVRRVAGAGTEAARGIAGVITPSLVFDGLGAGA